jgi:signal transduction histidine kinase
MYFVYIMLYPTENWFAILMIILGVSIISTIMGAFITSIIKQSEDRQRLIDDLTRSRANLMKAEREAGRLTERQRLARDIHDTIAQHFTSIIMHLAAARLSEPANLQTHIQQAEQAAREGLDEARHMIWDKKPEQLEGASLVENIEATAARWSVENSVHLDVAVTGSPQSLDPSIDLALLRISQEALHNIKKHARAQNVNITLSYMPDALALDVADDGKGFDAAQLDRRGFGLTSMRERAEELSGELTIESEPGKGTKIAVLIPIQEMT